MQILNVQYYPGRNVFAHRPVLRIILDMGVYYQKESIEFPLLEKNLLSSLPGLAGHHCARGKPGGFIERLREGTYLGHIVEHVFLEILSQAGQSVVWGKTVRGDQERTYVVIAECPVKEVGYRTADAAVRLVTNAARGEETDLKNELQEITVLTAEFGIGPSTAAVLTACKKRGIPYIPLPEGFLQLAYGKKQKKIFGTITSDTSCLATDIASDKTLCKVYLKDAGLPVLEDKVVNNEKEAINAAKDLGFPLVLKPNSGNHGRGVSVDLRTIAEIRAAFKLSYMYDNSVIVEKYQSGKHYRLLVIGGVFKACAERVPPYVVGDGEKNVRQLIEDLNQDPRRGEGHSKIRSKINVGPELILTISKKKHSLDEILPRGEVLVLRDNPNLSCGAGSEDVTSKVHQSFIECAELAAKAVGLDIAGIDIVAEDITFPINEQSAAIIEINASPGLRMHLFPDDGPGQPLGEEIVKMLFPTEESWHMQLVAVTGTNGKTTTTRLIGSMLAKSGECVGMTTTGGIFVNGKCILKGDTTGPESAKMVLKNPNVTAAVLETARGGILRSGLGYDFADVAIITNISEDHLGQDGIETLEDLAHVKALVAEAVHPKGTVVLNADDEHCLKIRGRITAQIVYFSVNYENATICRYLALGGEAYFIWQGSIIHASGDKYEVICSLSEIPIVFQGRALHNVSNVLGAVAAAKALKIDNDTIVNTLKTFGCSPEDNPGRLHIENINGITTIIDYGHNLAGYQRTAEFARTLTTQRLLAVVGVPGDRNNDSIIKVGAYSGQAFDEIWIKEDHDLRGRKSNEVAELLKLGASKHLQPKAIHVCLEETLAVKHALAKAKTGDVLLIFYEHLEAVLQTVKEVQNINEIMEITN